MLISPSYLLSEGNTTSLSLAFENALFRIIHAARGVASVIDPSYLRAAPYQST